MYEQDPPFAIQIEFTEGCSLYCSFCGLQGIREGKGDYKFMTSETVQHLANEIKRLGWNARLEIAMHGEPSMNPAFIDMIRILRKTLPRHQIMMTSNGSGFIPKGRVDAAFEAGLTILALDDYKNSDFVERILNNNGGKFSVPMFQYPQQPEGNPHRRVKQKFVSIISSIDEADHGTHAQLTNHCGAAFPLDPSHDGKRCAKPFRELAIRWDGSVALCCQDWRGVYNCGNITTTPLEQVWQGKPFAVARQALLHGIRQAPPCLGCNTTSYRVGLLPDKLGRKTLPKPTEEEMSWMKKHATSSPLSKVVLRPWEKK